MPSSGLVHLLVPLLPLLVFTSQLTAVFTCFHGLNNSSVSLLAYTSAGVRVGVEGVLLAGSSYMCPTVECILSGEMCTQHTA